MRKFIYLLFTYLFLSPLLFSQSINPADWPGMVGYWTFDNSADITNASVGNDLELFGNQVAVSGPSATDGATRIGTLGYYKCTHDIPANGGGAKVNEYSLLIDFKIPEKGQYYCFYQTNTDNSNDGEVFVNPTAHVGISATGYSYGILVPGQWYR